MVTSTCSSFLCLSPEDHHQMVPCSSEAVGSGSQQKDSPSVHLIEFGLEEADGLEEIARRRRNPPVQPISKLTLKPQSINFKAPTGNTGTDQKLTSQVNAKPPLPSGGLQ